MTPVSVRKFKKPAADVENDGLEEPDLTVGKRKGLCWAKRLKRVFNIGKRYVLHMLPRAPVVSDNARFLMLAQRYGDGNVKRHPRSLMVLRARVNRCLCYLFQNCLRASKQPRY